MFCEFVWCDHEALREGVLLVTSITLLWALLVSSTSSHARDNYTKRKWEWNFFTAVLPSYSPSCDYRYPRHHPQIAFGVLLNMAGYTLGS